MNAMAQTFSTVCKALLGLVLLGGLTACTGKEPEFMGDPVGVNRQARPQIIIKDSDATIDGHLIRYRVTSYTEAKAKLGDAATNLPDVPFGEVVDRFGYIVFAGVVANPNDVTYPVVSVMEVWLRQEDSMDKNVPCDEKRLTQHREFQEFSVQSWKNDAKTHGLSDEKLQKGIAEVLSRPCVMSAPYPENTFKGYLEVDGIPLTGNMSLAEIQARRKQAGLKPLRVDPNSGSPYYRASKAGNDTSAEQHWLFEIPRDKPKITDEDLLLKRIRIG